VGCTKKLELDVELELDFAGQIIRWWNSCVICWCWAVGGYQRSQHIHAHAGHMESVYHLLFT
jgi:hypothetical protein